MGKVDLQIILTMKMSEKKFIFQVYTIQRYFFGNSKQKDDGDGWVPVAF